MDDNSRSDQEEFYARAITEYYGVATDELDMNEGCIYTIIQTTDNGWWYAVDFEHGIDGWVPSNYLEKVSEKESSELRIQQKKQEEREAQKHAKLAAAGAYDIAPDEELEHFSDENDEEKGRASNAILFELTKRATAFRARQILQVKAAEGDINAQKEYKDLEKVRAARKLQQALNNPYKGRKEKIEKEMMMMVDSDRESRRQLLNVKKKRKKSRRPTMLDELSAEDIKHLNSHRPQFETIETDTNLVLDAYNNKAIELWNVDELLHYLTVNCSSSNTLELKNVIGHLCNKALAQSVCDEIVSKNGLNILFSLMKHGEKDIAISMSCCKCLSVLCESSLVPSNPAEKVSVFYLCTAVRNFYKQPIFCYTVFSCICNFVHRNDLHRDFVLNDKYNKVLLGYIIEGMNRFRYNDQEEFSHGLIEKVQISACLALENFAVTDNGRSLIGTDGVEAVLDTFIAHCDNDNVIYATLRALINLCIHCENAEHFIQNGGLNYLLTYLNIHNDDIQITNDIKITISRMLRNISTEEKTANTLCEHQALLDVMTALLKDAIFGTELFYEVIQFINALITTLNNNKIGTILMISAAKKGLFIVLINALEMSLDDDLDNNKYIKQINTQIASIIYYYIKSEDDEIKQIIFNQESLDQTETFIPSKLIEASISKPSSILTHYTLNILFECTNIADYSILVKQIFIKNGILHYLLTNHSWYSSQEINDNAIAIGIATILSYLQVWVIDHQQNYKKKCLKCDWDLNKYTEDIENINKYIVQNKINDTKSNHLKQTQSNLEKVINIIPVLLKIYP